MNSETTTSDSVNPEIDIFVVNYAGGKKLLECVDSILNSDYPALNVKVIENNSKDPALHTLRTSRQMVELIELDRNIGYAGAINEAAYRAQSELIIICNNDLIFERDCIAKMVRLKISSGAACISPRIINPDETPIEYNYNATLNTLFYLIPGVFDDRSKAVYPSGACFLIDKTSLLENLPPREFFLYFEDVFLGLSLRRNGKEISQANDAIVHHSHGFSVSRMSRLYLTFCQVRNRLTCRTVFLDRFTRLKLIGLLPFAILNHLKNSLMGTDSLIAVIFAFLHVLLSVNFIDSLKRRFDRRDNFTLRFVKEFITSKILPDNSPAASIINRFSKACHSLVRIDTFN